MNPIEEGKRLIKAALVAELHKKTEEIRAGRADMTFVEAWELAKKENPSLFAGAKRVEAGDWGSGAARSVHAARKPLARKPIVDNREVMLIMAADGTTVADIELE